MPDPLRDWTLPTDQEPLGARYGLLLDEVHADLLAIAEGHEPHGEGTGDWSHLAEAFDIDHRPRLDQRRARKTSRVGWR